MINHGYIKLDRQILSWEWYDDKNTFKLFIHLLLIANISDTEWHGITIPRGSVATSISKLSKETGLTEKEVRTALNHLERAGSTARQKKPQITVISIKNYDRFQNGATSGASFGQGKGKARAPSGQAYYIEEEKEEKKNKNIYYSASQKKQKKSAEKNSEPSFDLEAIKKHAIENTPKI